MSLLIIRCPRMPFIGGEGIGLNAIVNANSSAESSEEIKKDLFNSKSESFHWHLIENRCDTSLINADNYGFGSIASMPYGDQIVVLLPTIDVRLITMRIPLVNDEKLKLIMPGLLEEHLLSGSDQFEIQIIRPYDDAPALERTVAAVDKSWLQWLSGELSGLVSSNVRLIPDCYLLNPTIMAQQSGMSTLAGQSHLMKQKKSIESDLTGASINHPSVTFDIFSNELIWTVRLGEQTGASWIDQIDSDKTLRPKLTNTELLAYLPSYLQNETIAPFDLNSDWLRISAYQFISDSSNDGVNLLPDSFKPMGLKNSRITLDHQIDLDQKQQDQVSWSTTKKLAIYFLLSIFISYFVFAFILTVIDWAWKSQMNAMVISHTQKYLISKPQGIKTLLNANQLKIGIQGNSDVVQFIGELTLKKRMNGLPSKDDFSEMANELYRLMNVYGNQTIKSLEYKNSIIEFYLGERFFKSNQLSIDEFIATAISMDIAIISMGEGRFKLLPYAGLGAN